MSIHFATQLIYQDTGVAPAPILTRAVLEADGMASIIRRDSPGKVLQTEAQLTKSLRDTLSKRPAGDL